MANELQYYANPDSDSGQTITAKVYDNAGTQVGSDVTCTEVGTLAIYQGDMPSALSGVYSVRFFNGGAFVSQGPIQWDGTNEITLRSVAMAISSLNDVSTAEIEASLLNEDDGTQILNAITNAIGNQNVDEIALVSAIRSDIERADGLLATVDNSTVGLFDQIDDAQMDIELAIETNGGLTQLQESMLTLIRDLLEADERLTATRAIKYLKGTTSVILDKSVDSTVPVEITTTVTETSA